MASASWRYERAILGESFAAFRARQLSRDDLRRVNERLMDIIKDPSIGTPDPEVENLWFARVSGTDIGILYSLDVTNQRIMVSVIA